MGDADGESDMLGNVVYEDSEDEDLNYSDNDDETDEEIDAYAYASSDAEREVSDAFSDFGRERVNCKQFYIPEYLRHYYPEDTDEDSTHDEENEYSKSNSVKSFLILGELCENLIEYVKTILKKGTRVLTRKSKMGLFDAFTLRLKRFKGNVSRRQKSRWKGCSCQRCQGSPQTLSSRISSKVKTIGRMSSKSPSSRSGVTQN